MKEFTFHQHTGKKQHCIALAAACRSEICAALTVPFGTHMFLDILKQLVCGEKLRIAADNFQILIRVIGEIDKILYYGKQPAFTE